MRCQVKSFNYHEFFNDDENVLRNLLKLQVFIIPQALIQFKVLETEMRKIGKQYVNLEYQCAIKVNIRAPR